MVLKNKWLAIPGTPDWQHEGGGKVVVDEDNDHRDQFLAMTCHGQASTFEKLVDAKKRVEDHYADIKKLKQGRRNWILGPLAYIGASILYYLTLFNTLMTLDHFSVDELNWYRFGALVVIIIILPGLIVWNKKDKIKSLRKST